MKRAFDFISALVGLTVLSPLFIVLIIWIKLDSKGSPFYHQKRVGRNNKDFKIHKFRSMYVNSDRKGLLTVGNKDNRITRCGYYLRKYKLDELPQLFNVLKGEMSLVGPRPEVRKYVDLYTPEQMEVLKVRPGITDLASIRYRNENEILKDKKEPEQYYINHILPDKIELNLQYLSKRSLVSDIKLIFGTFNKLIN